MNGDALDAGNDSNLAKSAFINTAMNRGEIWAALPP